MKEVVPKLPLLRSPNAVVAKLDLGADWLVEERCDALSQNAEFFFSICFSSQMAREDDLKPFLFLLFQTLGATSAATIPCAWRTSWTCRRRPIPRIRSSNTSGTW